MISMRTCSMIRPVWCMCVRACVRACVCCFVRYLILLSFLVLLLRFNRAVSQLQNFCKTTDYLLVYGGLHDIVFNAAKTVIMSVGRNIVHKPLMLIAKHEIAWVDHCEYLGISFLARSNLVVYVLPIKRQFYGALSSIFYSNSPLVEPVKLQLVRAFCLTLFIV